MQQGARDIGLLFVLCLLAGMAGCSDDSGGPAGSPKSSADAGVAAAEAGGGDPCTARREECLGNQEICVVDEGEEVCRKCPEGQYAATADACAPIPGDLMPHDFGRYTLQPAEEINGLCQSWTLNNSEGFWVNTVELTNSGGYHHSNWLFVPDDMYDGPDGAWHCDERGYGELEAAVAGGVLFAQSTQARHEVQKFPEGVAVYVPPNARIIGGTHMLNTTADSLDTELELRLYTIPTDEVEVPLAPFRLSYLDLTIMPQSLSEFTGECDFATASPGSDPGDLQMDLYYVLPHYHALGASFRLEYFGGDRDGDTIFEIGGFNAEARGRAFDPPIDMRGASGFRFTCGFENPRSEEVGWGIGDQEMCVMLGFARSDFAFDATVPKGETQEEVGGKEEFSGSCSVLPLEFARGKGDL